MLVLQASLQDCLSLDPFAFQQDGLTASGVDVGRGQVAQALMVAPVIVVLDEGFDLGPEIARHIVVFQQDAVLQRLMPPLEFCPASWDDRERHGYAACRGL